jgi:F-type H+-transporting ATPase subunit a
MRCYTSIMDHLLSELLKEIQHSLNHIEIYALFFPVFLLLFPIRKRFRIVPLTIQTMVELIFEFFEAQIKPLFHDEEEYRKWIPFYVTVFYYILILNVMGIIPGFHPLTSNLNVTVSLSLIIFVVTFISAVKRKGLLGLLKGFVPGGVMFPINVLMMPIEVISTLAKPASLTIRLYANMFAGHMIIVTFLSLIKMFPYKAVIPLNVAVLSAMMLFECLISFIQAYVYAYLSAIFFTDVVYGEH